MTVSHFRENLLKKLGKSTVLRWFLNMYPPYLGAGVRVQHISKDFMKIKVKLNYSFYNRNYMGTQFGGSLYTMVDPFYVLMLIDVLGPDYVVWDKTSTIDFIRPGRGPVFADFTLDEATIQDIKDKTANGQKYFPDFTVEVKDGEGNVVALIHKKLYVRQRQSKKDADENKKNIQ